MKVRGFKGQLKNAGVELIVVPVDSVTLESQEEASGRMSEVDSLVGESFLGRLKAEGFNADNGAPFYFPVSGSTKLRGVLAVPYLEGYEYHGWHTGLRKLGDSIARAAKSRKVSKVAVLTQHIDFSGEDSFFEALIEGVRLGEYSFTRLKSGGAKSGGIKKLLLVDYQVEFSNVHRAQAIAAGNALARDIILTPPNLMRPKDVVSLVRELEDEHDNLKVTVWDRSKLKRMGAGGILSVASGSDHPPYLIRIVYTPDGTDLDEPIALVGKGVTLDSGGYNIKPGASIPEMKGDCGGAAAVIGAMRAIADTKPNRIVRAYVPVTENLINGDAVLPGDVITTMSGTTVEVLNTDAEGRLILADAITKAGKDGNEIIIDLATLTGACVVALGLEYAGVFSDDAELIYQIMASGEKASERFHELPLAPEYEAELRSSIADLRNIGTGRYGGAITAALFLQNFVPEDAVWAHIDIAGPALRGLSSGNVPGFAVGTLVRLVESY